MAKKASAKMVKLASASAKYIYSKFEIIKTIWVINQSHRARKNEQRITSLIKQLSHIKRINSVYFYLQIHKNRFNELRMKFEGVACVLHAHAKRRKKNKIN